MATWDEKIRVCVGHLDLEFAKQANDKKRAKEAIREAKRAKVSKVQFWAKLVEFLSHGGPPTKAHLDKQRKRFDQLWK